MTKLGMYYVQPKDVPLPEHGTVTIDRVALSEAFARWRRREVREALYQLEQAMGGNLHGLGDLKPEDLQ